MSVVYKKKTRNHKQNYCQLLKNKMWFNIFLLIRKVSHVTEKNSRHNRTNLVLLLNDITYK